MDEAALMRTMGFASFGGGFGGYDDEGGGEGDAAYSSSLSAPHDSSTSTRTSYYTNEAAVPMSVEGASGYAAGDHAAHAPAHVPAHAPADAHDPSTSAPVSEHSEYSPHDSAMGEAAPAPASYYWPDLTRPMWGVVSDTLKVGGDDENFFKGVRFSPDGTCFITNSEDRIIRLYETPVDIGEPPSSPRSSSSSSTSSSSSPASSPTSGSAPGSTSGSASSSSSSSSSSPWAPAPAQVAPVLTMQEGELVYDMAWNPAMNAADPASCRIITTSRDTPIHMWDAYTGERKGSYRGYVEEELSVISHHSTVIPFIHPLYPFIAVYTPMYTRYTCMYTICTPLNTSKHRITPHIHHIYTPL